jgi:hypothetical protein
MFLSSSKLKQKMVNCSSSKWKKRTSTTYKRHAPDREQRDSHARDLNVFEVVCAAADGGR